MRFEMGKTEKSHVHIVKKGDVSICTSPHTHSASFPFVLSPSVTHEKWLRTLTLVPNTILVAGVKGPSQPLGDELWEVHRKPFQKTLEGWKVYFPTSAD
jgi:hypothetical protein